MGDNSRQHRTYGSNNQKGAKLLRKFAAFILEIKLVIQDKVYKQARTGCNKNRYYIWKQIGIIQEIATDEVHQSGCTPKCEEI